MAASMPVEEPRPFVAVVAIPIRLTGHQIIETPEVFEPLCVRPTAIHAHVGPGEAVAAIHAHVGPGEAVVKRHVYIVGMGMNSHLKIPEAVAAARYVGTLGGMIGAGSVYHVFLGEK